MIRKLFKNYILLFLVIIFSMSTGYAYLNSSLYINGTSIISANVWDVGLDNLNVTAGSVVAIKEPTLDTATTTSFEVKLDNKEDFYEFTIDVVNCGEYDAKLGSLVETTGFTTEQEQYFEHTVTYQNNEPIQVNQLVKKDEFVRLKSKVEYKENVEITQVPESAKTLKLDIKMNYDLDDGTGISVKDNGVKITPIANGSLDAIGTIVTIGSEQFYTIGTEGDNVKLLSMYNLYVGGEYNLNTYGWKAYGEEATGMQDSTMLGYVSGQSIRKGTTAFSTNSTSYNGSIVEEYVNNYKIKLEEKFGLAVTESRLIVKEELLSLGCTLDNTTCKNAPSWVWTSSYWTGTAYDSIQVFNVNNDSSFMKNVYSYDAVERFGVRPVIIMLKDDIGKEIFNFTIDGVTYQAEVEMTWDEWIDSKYNVDGFTATYNNSCKSGLGVYYGTGILTTQLISGEFIDNTKIYSFNYSVEPTPDNIVGLCIKK